MLKTCSGALLMTASLLLAACSTVPNSLGEPTRAKNVILFIGDGMGISTITAARIFDGQSRGESGEENLLSFERFPNVALVKTYNSNQQVADSAGTATAIHSGVKTRAGVIGIGPAARRRDCDAVADNQLDTMADLAKRRGLGVGIVTTTRVTHATPATLYAHSPERDWESDEFIPEAVLASGCRDIARQLIDYDEGDGLDIVLGGGAREFYGGGNGGKRRSPADDLVTEWLSHGSQRRVVRDRTELLTIAAGQQVLGLFAHDHMTYIAELPEYSAEPSLSEMTAAAIDHLAGLENGYFLMVEGGRIDHGHHMNKAGYAMLEAQEFARAVQAAVDKVDHDDTLVLVTADHSHVFTLAGYPTRGNPILGVVKGNDEHGEPKSAPTLAADGHAYTTVGYANGPGAVAGERGEPETGVLAETQSLVPMALPKIDGTISDSETHGGEDVALYGAGPGAECVRGVIEQNRVFDIMRGAFGWIDSPCQPGVTSLSR